MESAGVMGRALFLILQHSTVISNIWLTCLFILRFLILVLAEKTIWATDFFVCNTLQPGCTAVCYDQAFPLSQTQYWALQLLVISAPTLLYLGYVLYQAWGQRELTIGILQSVQAQENQEKDLGAWNTFKICEHHSRQPGPQRTLIRTRIIIMLFKVIFEAVFLFGQWYLFGFQISSYIGCGKIPCPFYVDCYCSKAQGKTIFNIVMMVMSAVSLLLNLLELSIILNRLHRQGKSKCSATPASDALDMDSMYLTKATT